MGDKTRPILTPAQKAAYTATDFQTDAAGFALNPTTMNDDKLTTFGYASVTCADINDENLCTGTCTWNAASGCTGSGAMQSCVSKVVSTDSDDSNACYGKATAAACWTVKNQCFWTTSKTFTDGAHTDGAANTAITCTSPMVEYTYYVPDCTATTKDAAGKHNAKCDAGSVQWTSSNQVKYNAYRKCRPADNVVDTTSFQTESKNAYTTVVECGYKEDNNPYPVSSTIGTAKSGYQEFGARAFDNWDNVREYSDADGIATEYKNIDLFTDGAATAGNPCATTDGTTSPNWVSCAKQSGTPAAPQTSFVGNTLSHKTAVMGQGGYGAIYNGQPKKATTGVVSRWPQRGLYYRSGLLNCDSCDQKDFENDFLVVYRYTDKEGNSARPLMRKVVTRDTTPPSVRLIGDRTLENSAGSYVHSTASSNDAQCVQAQNRSAACDTTQTVNDKSSCETAGRIWSYEDADNYAASGNGLFDTDRIITYFEHRDDCDKDIITTVSMYSGLCPSAGATDTRTKLTCTAGTECYAGIFQYRSSNAASDPDAYEQPPPPTILCRPTTPVCRRSPSGLLATTPSRTRRWTRLATSIQSAATSTTSTTRSPSSRSWVRTR